MRRSLLFLGLVFSLISCSGSDQELEHKELEIKSLQDKNRTLLEQNYALMQRMMFFDSLKVEIKKLSATNNGLEYSSKEVKKLQEEVRLMMRLNAKKASQESAVQNEDFDLFFDRFMQDSSFQKSRINFPLQYLVEEYDSIRTVDSLKIEKDQWEYQTFYLHIAKERSQVYDNYEGVLSPNNKRMVHWYTTKKPKSQANYYFEGKEGKWFLNQIEKFD
ncbi:MAG: DUF4348 domain-containing protein [Flavobacteriaceae bacterium]